MLANRSPILAPIAIATRCRESSEVDDCLSVSVGVLALLFAEAMGVGGVPPLKSTRARLTSTSADSAPMTALGLDIRTMACAL